MKISYSASARLALDAVPMLIDAPKEVDWLYCGLLVSTPERMCIGEPE